MIREAITKSVEGTNLEGDVARSAMKDIMEGGATPAQIASFITAMRIKGETVQEIASFVQEMRERSVRIRPRVNGRIVDTCGTGGDGVGTFNISTGAMFVARGAGVPVAKHGNRSVSSNCGSADVLECLGARLDLSPKQVEAIMERTGLCFMFAPVFHPAMKHAIGPRVEIGIRTFFNILGPLTNPCQAKGHVMGVYDGNLTEKMARVASAIGLERAFVVHGEDGLDEISLTTRTKISEARKGEVRTYTLRPEDFGLERVHLIDLRGGNLNLNAEILINIMTNRDSGPRRDVVAINGAAAIAAASDDLSITEAFPLAMESIESGRALRAMSGFLRANGVKDGPLSLPGRGTD